MAVFTYLLKEDYFRQVFISSGGIDRKITGYACLKSPISIISAFPNGLEFRRKSCNNRSRISKGFLCAIFYSSQTISLHGSFKKLHVQSQFQFVMSSSSTWQLFQTTQELRLCHFMIEFLPESIYLEILFDASKNIYPTLFLTIFILFDGICLSVQALV